MGTRRTSSAIGYPLSAIGNALATVAGWTGVIIITLVIGFSLGDWIGHHEVRGLCATFEFMSWIFVLWLVFPQMFIAYAVTALAWYVPIHFESVWLRLSGAIANLSTWLIVAASIARVQSW